MSEEPLPIWFIRLKKVCSHLAIGCIAAYMFTVNITINQETKELIKLILTSIGLPCIILSGSNAIDLIKKIKND